MKTITSIALMFIWLGSANAQGLVFETTDWQTSLAKAKKENKLIFIDCYTVWCKPCKWMDANVFPVKAVGDFYNEKFINVKMDMEKGDGIDVAKKYNVNSFPTYLVLDYRGNVIHREGGAMEEEKFIALGKLALDPSRNLAGMSLDYDEGNRDREFLRSFILALGKGKQHKKQKEVFEKYYQSFSGDLINEQDFDVIMSVVQPDDEALSFVLKNREAYKPLVGEKEFDFKVYTKFILPFGRILSTEGIEALHKKADEYKPLYPRIIQRTEDLAILRWYNKNKKTYELAGAAIDFVQTYSPNNPSEILYYLGLVADAEPTHPSKYSGAISYMKDVVNRYPGNSGLADVYAALLFRAGKTDEAVSVAEKLIKSVPEGQRQKLRSLHLLEETRRK